MQGAGDDAVKDYRDRRDDSDNDTDSGFSFVPFVSQVSSVPFNPFISCTSLASPPRSGKPIRQGKRAIRHKYLPFG